MVGAKPRLAFAHTEGATTLSVVGATRTDAARVEGERHGLTAGAKRATHRTAHEVMEHRHGVHDGAALLGGATLLGTAEHTADDRHAATRRTIVVGVTGRIHRATGGLAACPGVSNGEADWLDAAKLVLGAAVAIAATRVDAATPVASA